MAGYLSNEYSLSFEHIGTPVYMPDSEGWLIKRPIGDTGYFDAMGCYPIFCCNKWDQLHTDIVNVKDHLISIALVTDPFGDYDYDYLKATFQDVVFAFKQHFIIDLACTGTNFVHSHHRKNARQALQHLTVERSEPSNKVLQDWRQLYANLVARHAITGLTDFAHESFTKQFDVPGLIVFRAMSDGECVGMLLWYVQNNRAYYHLGAYSQKGYDLKASFALFWASIEYFRDTPVCFLSLGGGAGLQNHNDGLTRFKQGWATGTRTAYFCGRIIDRHIYDELTKKQSGSNGYFPSYRVSGSN